MPIVSLPLNPAPGAPGTTYNVDLYKNYGYGDYLAAFGVKPPAFDPLKPERGWFDTSADASQPFKYSFLNQTTGTVDTFTIPAGQINAPNIPTPLQQQQSVDVNAVKAPLPIRALNADEKPKEIGPGFWAIFRDAAPVAVTPSTPIMTSDDLNNAVLSILQDVVAMKDDVAAIKAKLGA